MRRSASTLYQKAYSTAIGKPDETSCPLEDEIRLSTQIRPDRQINGMRCRYQH